MDGPKEPRSIAKVHQEILEHPDYKTKLGDGTRWAFEISCVGDLSACDRENNKWSREIWRFLYKGVPLPEYY